MKRLLYYLPLHFVVLGILGICFQFFTKLWNLNSKETLFLLGFLTILVYVIKNRVLRTLLTFLLFFFIGVSSVYINDHRNYDSFYENQLEENSTLILQIHSVLKSGNYYNKYEAKVLKVDDKKTIGTILLNIKKDSTSIPLKVDNQLLLKPVLKELIPPLNPNQFNYKSY